MELEETRMYRRDSKGWLKHWDFMVLDLVVLQLSFVLAYLVRHGWHNPYRVELYANMGVFLLLCDFIIIFFTEPFRNILKRGYYKEFEALAQQCLFIELFSAFYLFSQQTAEAYSRTTMYLMAPIYLCLSYSTRLCWKHYLRAKRKEGNRALLIVTRRCDAGQVIRDIRENNYSLYRLVGLVLVDGAAVGEQIDGVEVVADVASVAAYAQKGWVDEVFISLPQSEGFPQRLVDEFVEMGVAVHVNLFQFSRIPGTKQLVEKVGNYTVLTATMNYFTTKQAFIKRTVDILGGLVGCLATAVLFVFVAPAIYISSPGPIFFAQERVGKNGKRFKMYKFRSMYLDAEERKKELLAQNRVNGGLMFKVDFDPRIIGNRILPDGTHKTGIGQFIRSTSIDEFPQFFNVLKGDMSIVGTRPPLVSEFNAYEPHHRARMAIKPGITGMWQVSGRSEITDFEEVVRLDTQYINEWSMGLDLKIFFKTISAVLKRKGSM